MSVLDQAIPPPPKVLSTNGKVVLALKEGILSGTYAVGALLPPEEELIRQLEVSRVSLREGIKQLEALGWLHIERGNGTRIVQPGFSVVEHTVEFLARFEILRFEHLHQLRGLIEVEAAGEVARIASDVVVGRLREANAAIARDHTRPSGYVDADVAFHDALLESAPNPLFARLMSGFRKYLVLSRRLSFAGGDSVLDTVKAHGAIIDAIAARDADGARLRMREHLVTTLDQITKTEDVR